MIARLLAVDADAGKNSELKYGVTDDTRSEYFDVDTNLGAVIVNRGLGDVDGRTFPLEVTVHDNAPPKHSVSSMLYVTVNRSLAFVGDLDHSDFDGGSWFHVFISSNNVLIVVVLSAVSAVIAIILIIAICFVVRRQDAHGKHSNKYNCRTETLKMLQSKGGNGSVAASGPAGSMVGTDSVAGTPSGSNHCCDARSKHLCLTMEEQRCNNEQSLERSGQSWPSTIDNQVLQVQASSDDFYFLYSLISNDFYKCSGQTSDGRLPKNITKTS